MTGPSFYRSDICRLRWLLRALLGTNLNLTAADWNTLAPVTVLLPALLANTSIAIGQLDVYVETGRGEGRLASIDAVSSAVSLQALPGVR